MKRIFTILCALAAEPAEGSQSASYYPIKEEDVAMCRLPLPNCCQYF